VKKVLVAITLVWASGTAAVADIYCITGVNIFTHETIALGCEGTGEDDRYNNRDKY